MVININTFQTFYSVFDGYLQDAGCINSHSVSTYVHMCGCTSIYKLHMFVCVSE